jgi:CubicO group peptidase (beta-lactamase class C family)
MLEIARPASIGFDAARIDRVYARLTEWTHEDRIAGAGIAIGRHGKMLEPRVFGRHRPDMSSPAMPDDAIFLIASPTKPIAVTAIMMLVERGQIELDDLVVEFVPEFAPHGKDKIRLRHLMTHTSGLPDQLPENIKLRSEHAPLDAFVRGTCQVKPDFAPGTAVQYQSMGILMLAEVLRRVTGKSLSDFLRDELLQPLGLKDTALGASDGWWTGSPAKADRIAHVRLDAQQADADWNWNTRYWRSLGVPWGGLLATPREFAMICQLFIDSLKGEGPTLRLSKVEFGFGQRSAADSRSSILDPPSSSLLSPAAARAMTTNQLQSMAAVPEEDRRTRPWGLGWRLNWPGHSANFGDLLGPRVFGHWGATGTLVWIDPDADAFLVLFTTQPQEPEGRYLARVSNMVCAAMV